MPKGAGTLVAIVVALIFTTAFVGAAAASFGVERVEQHAEELDGTPAIQAGSHPYALTTTLLLKRHPLSQEELEAGLGDAGPLGHEIADGDAKDVEATLPAGVIVDLLGVEQCSEQQLAKEACPASSQVGEIAIESPVGAIYEAHENPVFNISPSSPKVAGALGFTVANIGFIAHLIGSAHAGGDYGISAQVPGLPQVADSDGLTLTLWGDPSAASHCHQQFTGGPCVTVPKVSQPFLTLPTSCPSESTEAVARRLSTSVTADSWQEPGVWTPLLYSSPLPAMIGCDKLSFTPSIEVRPETTIANTPTGVSVTLKIPQVEALGSLAEANLREALITLPAGLVVSPSAISGLGACSEAQIGLLSRAAASCPEASRIGSVQARTPLLNHPVGGSVYLAQQGNAGPAQGSNPFGSLIAMYVVVEGSGVQIKAAGEVRLNQGTGQLTTRFTNLPQLPYSEMTLNFFGGPRAALVPVACGSYTTTSLLTPYSAPESGPPATPQSDFTVDSGCNTGGFAPTLAAGTTSNQAGGYSPFVTTFSRRDGEQELAAIQEHIPPGLLASISHVALCGEPQAQEGSCGPESRIGTISVVAGPGPDPFDVPRGRMYLTGPYEGAPFGLSVVVPARGGPFDLGNVVVRAALSVDQKTSAVTVTTGPLPLVLQGVPTQTKSVTVEVDRPEFIFNPTSCERKTITATMQGSLGSVATTSVPFQAAACAALQFKPRFSASASGHTSRTKGASLDVKLTYPQGPPGSQANIAKVKVDLPKQLPARLTTLQKACPSATFEANPASCPAASAVAVAKATTPLLPVTLSGPAYFVSYGGAKFPELIIVLQGDGVSVELHGETFISKHGITSSTFSTIPDVPVGSFELYFPQGPNSALAGASGSLCNSTLTIPTAFVAQNGAQLKQTTKIALTGCRKAKGTARHRKQIAKRPGKAHGSTVGLLSAVLARPVVNFAAAAVPIPINLSKPHSPTYPGTGAILGAPTAVEAQLTIRGTEYGGSPSPLTGIKFYAPAGAKVNAQGFATCSEVTLKEMGAAGCPAKSFAGALGEARGVVSFGPSRVYEKVTLQGFFGPAHDLLFYVLGNSPASIELISKGAVANARPPFGKVFTGEVPLVESVPEALDASVEQIKVKVGAAFKQGRKLISYLTAPRTCPKGGFPLKVELSFLSGETVPANDRIPCPRHKA